MRRQAFFGMALLAMGAGMLAGCAAPPPPKQAALPPPPPSPPPVVHHLRPIPLPERKPLPPPEVGGPVPEDTGAVVAAAPEPSAPPPAPSAPTPAYPARSNELIGLDQQAAVRLFGAAAEKSEKPPATVWRWRSPTCELDLYFYLDLRSGRMRSLHYVFKGDAGGQQDCLRSLAFAAPS